MSDISRFSRRIARQKLADEDNREEPLICDLYINPDGTSEVIVPRCVGMHSAQTICGKTMCNGE